MTCKLHPVVKKKGVGSFSCEGGILCVVSQPFDTKAKLSRHMKVTCKRKPRDKSQNIATMQARDKVIAEKVGSPERARAEIFGAND